MFFALREIAGWLLIVFAVILVRTALQYTEERQVFQAGAVIFASMAFLKAGVFLVRISTAARICLRQERSEPDA